MGRDGNSIVVRMIQLTRMRMRILAIEVVERLVVMLWLRAMEVRSLGVQDDEKKIHSDSGAFGSLL
jgi:hypothetical protein